jgi:hypothetical protein
MKAWRGCDREDDVRRASAAGRWTPALEGHVAVCERCYDVRLVTRALAAPIADQSMPVDPAILWARASAAARVRAIARADRVLTLSQIVVAATAVAGLAVAARVLDVPTDPGGADITPLVLAGGGALTAVTAFVVRWAKL